MEATLLALKAENALLKSQVFRYCNIKADAAELLFLTGLTFETWDALWKFLKATPANIQSAKSATSEAEGRYNCPGAG